MRHLLIVLAFALAGVACTEHGKGGGQFCFFNGDTHGIGELFPAGDGCNTCECLSDGTVTCTELACPDGGMASCAPTGACADGPACGNACCRLGEQCLDGVCSCGGGAACTGEDFCATGGPVGGNVCGSICCGGPNSPCPL